MLWSIVRVVHDGCGAKFVVLKLAAGLGIVIANPWITWFKAACVPGILGLILTPLLVHKLYPPEIQDTPDAPAHGKGEI